MKLGDLNKNVKAVMDLVMWRSEGEASRQREELEQRSG